MDLKELSKAAIQAAYAAGKIIVTHIEDDVQVESKQGGNTYASQVVTHVDLACEAVIRDVLSSSCLSYDLGFLAEESEDDRSRFTKDYFWCIDPMDGTLAFINKGHGFAVSIALVARDGTPVIGVVYDPTTDTLYHAVRGAGAYKDMLPWSFINENNYLTYVTDKRLADTVKANEISKVLEEKKNQLDLSMVREQSGGGAVMNAIYVIEQGPAIMLKLPKEAQGGGSIWDYAATACIYNELGLRATAYDGGELVLNSKDGTFMNSQGICFENI